MTAIETLLLEKKMKGPCWLKISNVHYTEEGRLQGVKHILAFTERSGNYRAHLHVMQHQKPPPALKVVFLSMVQNEKTRCLAGVTMLVTEWHPERPSPPPITCNIMQGSDRIRSKEFVSIYKESNLLDYFSEKFLHYDPDIVVGYDLEAMGALYNDRVGYRRRQKEMGRVVWWKEWAGRLKCDTLLLSKEFLP